MYAIQNPQARNLSSLQRYAISNSDFFLPQREHAFARQAVHGSFTSEFLSTPSGLFSILIFRLITFNTEALRQTPADMRKVAFTDLSDWNAYLNLLKQHFGDQPQDFYCNRNAFSHQTQTERVLANANQYWIAATTSDWPSHFAQETTLSFQSCMSILKKLRANGKSLRQLGLLARYLITTDLVYGGLVMQPTPEDIAPFIFDLKAGGAKGLRYLGYCSPAPKVYTTKTAFMPTKPDILQGFISFFEDIDSRLSREEKIAMGWDAIMAEHALCKVSRLNAFFQDFIKT